MNEPVRHPIRTWLAIVMTGLVAIPAGNILWHLTTRYFEPPEEQRWVNNDISSERASILDEIEKYSSRGVPASIPDGDGTEWNLPNVAVYSSPDVTPPTPAFALTSLSRVQTH